MEFPAPPKARYPWCVRLRLASFALFVVGASVSNLRGCTSTEAEARAREAARLPSPFTSPPSALSPTDDAEDEDPTDVKPAIDRERPTLPAARTTRDEEQHTRDGAQPTREGSPKTPEGEREATEAREVRYPFGALHSPMSRVVVERMKAVLASSKGKPGVVAKVGDSLTVNSYFLGCFAGSDVRLGDHADLEETRAFFAATPADPKHSSFDRVTLAAQVCWSSTAVVAGSPCPLEQEITAIEPSFAVVLIGTNDTFPAGPERLDAKLSKIVDISLRRGVVPLLTTLPQRRDTAEARLLVPEMNAVIRAIAQARAVPLIDLFTALAPLPRYGLGKDGIHLTTYTNGTARGCWFDERALEKGINRRNLLTLEALSRVRRFLLEDEPPEADPPPLAGEGSWDSPYEIDALPFSDDRDVSTSGSSERVAYDCTPSRTEKAGPEVVYRLAVTEETHLRARLFQAEGARMTMHLIEDPGRSSHCIQRADKLIDATVKPGVYRIAVDSTEPEGKAQPRDFRLTVVRTP